MNHTIKLQVDNKLREVAKQIMQIIDDEKKVLINAPMGSGKTYLVMNDLKEYIKKHKLNMLMIMPNVIQNDQVQEEYKVYSICNGKSYHEEQLAGSTPDSMYKAIDAYKRKNENFILVVDEAHEIYTSRFRSKAFRNVKEYEKLETKVIYMTATSEPLDIENFDTIVEVEKTKQEPVNCRIVLVDNYNLDTRHQLIQEAALKSDVVASFRNDIKENETLGQMLKDCLVKEKALIEPHQENLLGHEAQYVEVERNKAYTVYSAKKEAEVYKQILKGTLPNDLKYLVSTEFVQAGCNINTTPNTSVILSGLDYYNIVKPVQTVGRFRNGVKEVILYMPKPSETVAPKSKQTVRNEFRARAEEVLPVLNNLKHQGAEMLEGLASQINAYYNEETQCYEVDMLEEHAAAYDFYVRQLLKAPNVLKMELEKSKAIKFNVTIEEDGAVTGTRGKELQQLAKQEQAETLEAAKKFILNLPNDWIYMILEEPHKIDQRKAENKEIVENMEIYHTGTTQQFKSTLKNSCNQLFNGDIVAAYKDIMEHTPKKVKENLKQWEVKQINKDINKIGSEPYLKEVAKTTQEVRQAKIRHELKDLEAKQGRMSNKKVNELAQLMLDQGYYKGKKINLEKAQAMLKQDLDLIYNITLDSRGRNRISKIKKD